MIQREYYRISVRLTGSCCLKDPETERIFLADILDISSKGIRLKLEEGTEGPDSLQPDAVFFILNSNICVEGVELSRQKMRIVWRDGLEFGCRFLTNFTG